MSPAIPDEIDALKVRIVRLESIIAVILVRAQEVRDSNEALGAADLVRWIAEKADEE